MLYVVGELRAEMIKPPTGSIHLKILGSHRWNPFFKVTIVYLGYIILGLESYLHKSSYVSL